MPPVLSRVNHIFTAPFYYALFLKIAEPRVIRILLFAVYSVSFWAGVAIIIALPELFVKVIGQSFALGFAIFIILGSFSAGIAVLPGIWWLERVGIILLTTSVLCYVTILMFIDASPVVIAFILGLVGMFAIRWVEIRGAQLAPREA